jgi:hypothetical protein
MLTLYRTCQKLMDVSQSVFNGGNACTVFGVGGAFERKCYDHSISGPRSLYKGSVETLFLSLSVQPLLKCLDSAENSALGVKDTGFLVISTTQALWVKIQVPEAHSLLSRHRLTCGL